MAKQTINIGTVADDGTGSTIRAGGDITNDNFNEIYNLLGDGSDLYSWTFSDVTDTVVGRATTDTLTNKTINGPDNTLTNIANGSLSNSSVTIGSTSVSLGATETTFSGITSLEAETLTNASGNLLVDSATYITEFRGGGGTDGQIQLNCSVNSHGQIISAQPHSEGVTNTMLLPKGGNSTLVSEIATQTLTNKTIGVGQLTCATRAYTGDGSTTDFTVTNGQTVDNVLVFLNGVFQRPTTDYTISGTTLTFVTAPVAADTITIKEL